MAIADYLVETRQIAVDAHIEDAEAISFATMSAFITEKGSDRLLPEMFPKRDTLPGLELAVDRTRTWGSGHSLRFSSKIYYDTPMGLVLLHKQKPIAVAGVREEEDFLVIKQLQGLKSAKKVLYGLGRWEMGLVRAIECYAQASDKNYVAIQPAAQNPWVEVYMGSVVHNPTDPEGMHPERAERRYDWTALKMGYTYDVSKQLYVKNQPFPAQFGFGYAQG